MNEAPVLLSDNRKLAQQLTEEKISLAQHKLLAELTHSLRFSLAGGDLLLLQGRWYVTHTGLVRLAQRRKCCGIHVEAVDQLRDSAANRFALKATVYPCKGSVGFVGYGDADPSTLMCLPWSAVPRCGSPKRELSIVLCARPTASVSARSKKSGRFDRGRETPASKRQSQRER